MAGSGAAKGPGRRRTLARTLGAALGLAVAVASAQDEAGRSPPARPAPAGLEAAEGQALETGPLQGEAGEAAALEGEAEAPGEEPASAEGLGPVTGLPLPRFVSLRASEARARRGPGLDHRVDWLYRLPGLPLRVTAEHGHWRRVEDIEGLGGWVHYSLISGERTVIVTERLAALHRRPEEGSPVVAQLEAGVVASLDGCREGWCQIEAQDHRGWTRDAGLWGVEEINNIN